MWQIAERGYAICSIFFPLNGTSLSVLEEPIMFRKRLAMRYFFWCMIDRTEHGCTMTVNEFFQNESEKCVSKPNRIWYPHLNLVSICTFIGRVFEPLEIHGLDVLSASDGGRTVKIGMTNGSRLTFEAFCSRRLLICSHATEGKKGTTSSLIRVNGALMLHD
jgi:hypothetical protein